MIIQSYRELEVGKQVKFKSESEGLIDDNGDREYGRHVFSFVSKPGVLDDREKDILFYSLGLFGSRILFLTLGG